MEGLGMKKRKREGVLNMQRVRENLRLVAEGHDQSEIAAASGASRAAVQDYLRRAEAHIARILAVAAVLQPDEQQPLEHSNLRGRNYFH
jgi:predicted transcriptional regulator